MCEFCNFPNQQANANRDAFHSDFAGFFSADAIEAAVRQAKQQQSKANKSETHKTKRRHRRSNAGDGNDEDEEAESGGGVDDDGT
ncbi:hypothetical protein IV203_002836 [Nitzschia inconspicua]|uniref:Uncharacterized protein n=1 Tax=Nitzschia inconspicua TaxID=303405 RepID=A0A9K3L262_9STRA|nr:hypothetical protein IV203_002836 [Nitzschia inconspicua]